MVSHFVYYNVQLFIYRADPSSAASQLLPNSARAGQLTSEVVCVDDHLSLGQLSATQISDTTHLSQLPSLRADGTETQLLAESFNKSMQLQCNTSNSLGGNEEAIIEMEPVEMIPQTRSPPAASNTRSSR